MFILCNVLLSDLASVDPATAWSLVVFAVAVGASIGSFMNVVVYRVPAGMSLLRPASRCPHCEHPIRATDNIPVLGWLRLRGRCRDCGARIARRYPLVELWVAVLFGAMAWADTIAGGFNLPGSFSDSQCWGIFAYHMFLLCSLLVVALIEFDGNEATTLIAAIGLVAVLLGAFFPALHPISPPLTGMRETLTAPPRTVALLDGLVGWVVGIVMGCVASPVTDRGPSGLKGRYSAVLSLAMVGAFLGWQATAGLSAATVMIYSSTVMYRAAIPRLAKIPIGGVLFLLVVCWLFAWRPIVERVPRLGASADHWTMIVAGLVVFGAATTAQLISRPNRESN